MALPAMPLCEVGGNTHAFAHLRPAPGASTLALESRRFCRLPDGVPCFVVVIVCSCDNMVWWKDTQSLSPLHRVTRD